MMGYIKRKLKENNTIIRLYESVMTPVHYGRRKIGKWLRKIIKWVITKSHFSYGSLNPEKTFFVIGNMYENCGLYSTILMHLPYLEYALKKGYIPVFDFKNTYAQMLQDEEKKGKENSWEYYYEQPVAGVTLDEVYKSKHVIQASRDRYLLKMPDWNAFPFEAEKFKFYSELIQKYFRPQSALKNRIDIEKDRIFTGEKVLGVSLRMGYLANYKIRNKLIEGHPRILEVEDYIDYIEKKMAEWHYTKIFLSIDDRECQRKMIEHFGEKCLYMERRLIHYFENGGSVCDKIELSNQEFDGVASATRIRAEEYLVEVHLLALCDSACMTKGGGATFAYFYNGGKYEHLEVFEDGKYHIK